MIISLSAFYEAEELEGRSKAEIDEGLPRILRPNPSAIYQRSFFKCRRLRRTIGVVNFLRIFEALASLFPSTAKVVPRSPAANYASHSFCDASRKKKGKNSSADLFPPIIVSVMISVLRAAATFDCSSQIGLQRATLVLGSRNFHCPPLFPKSTSFH